MRGNITMGSMGGDGIDAPYCFIDPGETSGWARFGPHGDLVGFGRIDGADEFLDWFESLDPFPKEVGVEDYRIRPGVSHAFSRVPTIQVIGMIKRVCKKRGVSVHLQPASVLKIGYKYAGIPYPKGHPPDEQSALCHGTYWLVQKGIKKHRLAGK